MIPLDQLLEKVDSRYTLVAATAKRARELTERAFQGLDKEVSTKPVSRALYDIGFDKIKVFRNQIEKELRP